MTEIRIDLQTPEIQEAIQTALLAQLNQEARDAMILKAIQSLVTKPTSGYGPKTSPLEHAFSEAVAVFARTEVERMVAENVAWQEQIRQKVAASFSALLNSDTLSTAVADAMVRIMRDT